MTEEQCAELHRQVEEEAAPYWKGNSKDAAEELAALKEWKAGAEKTLLENAALLEKSAAMFMAAKDENGKLRELVKTGLGLMPVDDCDPSSGCETAIFVQRARALLEEK